MTSCAAGHLSARVLGMTLLGTLKFLSASSSEYRVTNFCFNSSGRGLSHSIVSLGLFVRLHTSAYRSLSLMMKGAAINRGSKICPWALRMLRRDRDSENVLTFSEVRSGADFDPRFLVSRFIQFLRDIVSSLGHQV